MNASPEASASLKKGVNSGEVIHDTRKMAAFNHQTVLLQEAVGALLFNPDGIYIDGTFGRGGHTRLILERLSAAGRLIAFDKDPQAIAAAQEIKDPRFSVLHASFVQMKELLALQNVSQVNGVLLDLGISSPQVDEAARGFSFMRDGPLDMRMDTSQGETVAQWLAYAPVAHIKEVIKEYGEERFALQIAEAIAACRAQQPLETTHQLAELVARVVRAREKGRHPATRTFQALRIHINRELEELPRALSAAVSMLNQNGRLVVIAFHSLEDRIVKRFISHANNPGALTARLPLPESARPQPWLKSIARIYPTAAEVKNNPRARSAVMRVAERTAALMPLDALGA